LNVQITTKMNWLDKWLTALPIIIMIEMGLAIIPYTIRGKYGSAMYWLGGLIVTAAATFLIKRLG